MRSRRYNALVYRILQDTFRRIVARRGSSLLTVAAVAVSAASLLWGFAVQRSVRRAFFEVTYGKSRGFVHVSGQGVRPLTVADLERLRTSLGGRLSFRGEASTARPCIIAKTSLPSVVAALDYWMPPVPHEIAESWDPFTFVAGGPWGPTEAAAGGVCAIPTEAIDPGLLDGMMPGETVHVGGLSLRVAGLVRSLARNPEDAGMAGGLGARRKRRWVIVIAPLSDVLKLQHTDSIAGIQFCARDGSRLGESDVAAVRAVLTEARPDLEEHLVIHTSRDILEAFRKAHRSVLLASTFIPLISPVLSIGVVAIVYLSALRQLRPELELRRALGATRRRIVLELAASSAVLAAIGLLVGVVAGVGVVGITKSAGIAASQAVDSAFVIPINPMQFSEVRWPAVAVVVVFGLVAFVALPVLLLSLRARTWRGFVR